MKARTRTVKIGGLIALSLALVFLPTIGLAQDGEKNDIQDQGSYCESPQAIYLVEELGFDCELMVEGGIGLGDIKKAWLMSQSLPGFEDQWENLLALKKDGLGWGQIKKAIRMSSGDPETTERYLTMRADDIGWGQISHSRSLADAGIIDFDTALELFQSGKGWEEIKAELGIEGPPPWAGGKKKASAGLPDDEAGGKTKRNGPPPWAQNGKGKDEASISTSGEG